MGVFTEMGQEWYEYQYPDYEVTDNHRELVCHSPSGEEELSALARCEYYLRRLHILHWVLILIFWGAAAAYSRVTSASCQSAYAMAGVLSVLEAAGMVSEFFTVRRKAAKTVILSGKERAAKRGLFNFRPYGFYYAAAMQESSGVIVKDLRLYRDEYEKASIGSTMYVFRAGLRYVCVCGAGAAG